MDHHADPTPGQVSLPDVTLAVFEWNREARGGEATILLAHATGFHARCWDRVVAHLGGRHVVAIDQRGHGRSTGAPPVHWRQFGDDLAAVTRALDLRDLIGVGHSMGGHATVEAAALEPSRFRRLVLIDPVIGAPAVYEDEVWAGRVPDSHPTARRRNRFASPDEMIERFAERPPFDSWDPQVLRDYCVYGTRRAETGEGVVLACRPEFEAQVYATSRGNRAIHARVRAIETPVLVVRAMEPPDERDLADFRYSPTWPALAGAFRYGRDLHLADRTHFLPMQDPALVARLVLDGDAPAG